MKISTEHYAALSDQVDALDSECDLSAYAESYQRDGLRPKRFRWDCLQAAHINVTESPDSPDRGRVHIPLYDYCDDTHIDTALRRYMKDRGLIWAATA